MPRDGTFADLLAGLQKKANLEDDVVREMRIFEAHSGKIYKEYQEDAKIAGINEYVTLYAERIPEEELQMQAGERTINAFNFDREPSRPHGIPFKFVMKPVCISYFVLLGLLVLTLFRARSSRKQKRDFPNEPASKANNLRRSNLLLFPSLCILTHGILMMVSLTFSLLSEDIETLI